MKSIAPGSVYILKSPFKSTVSELHEKKLSYMLGTLSCRPVLIMRAPMPWDIFDQVTVIPSLSKQRPAINIKLEDNYGEISDIEYNFIPHSPHTIPINRLGKYVGRLDEAEFQEILYAYKWIMDPYMQANKKYPIPACYQTDNLNRRTVPDTRIDFTRLCIDDHMTIHSDDPQLDGAKLDLDFTSCVSSYMCNKVVNDSTYHVDMDHDSPNMDTITAEEDIEPCDDMVNEELIVNRSSFNSEIVTMIMQKLPSSVDIITEFTNATNHTKYAPISIENDTDVYNQLFGKLKGYDRKNLDVNNVIKIFNKLSAVDVYFLCANVSTRVICTACRVPMAEAAAIKRLCTYVSSLEEPDAFHKISIHTCFPAPSCSNSYNSEDSFDTRYPPVTDYKEATTMIRPIRKYLNDIQISVIPEHLIRDFVRIPEKLIKKFYVGSGFEHNYSAAISKYRTMIIDSDR